MDSLWLLLSCLFWLVSPQLSYNSRLALGRGQCDFHSLLCHLPPHKNTVPLPAPTETSNIQVSPGWGLACLLWEGWVLQSYNHWSGSPPKLLKQLQSLLPGLGTTAAVVHVQVPEIFPSSYTISLPSVFRCPLQSLASKLHIRWDSIGCSLCSSENHLGVPVGYMSKWVQLPPTWPLSSLMGLKFLISLIWSLKQLLYKISICVYMLLLRKLQLRKVK